MSLLFTGPLSSASQVLLSRRSPGIGFRSNAGDKRQPAIPVTHAGFWSCASEGRAVAKQILKVVFIIRAGFQCIGGAQGFLQFNQWWDMTVGLARVKISSRVRVEQPQGSQPRLVIHP